MKRYCFVMLLVSLLVMNMQIMVTEAADYYLGVYEDGREAYLMDEDIEIFQMFSRNGTPEGKEYQCTVKAVNPDKATDFDYVFYSVTCSQFLGMQRDGEQLYNLRTQHEFFESHPVEKALAKYIGNLHESQFGSGGW